MAFKKIETGFAQAHKLGNGKDGTVRKVTGFIVGTKVLKIKGQKPSTIYKLVPVKGGKVFEMWGNGSINFAIGEMDFKKEVANKLWQFTFDGMLPKKKGKQPGVKVIIECDDTAKMPDGAGRIKF